MFHLTDGKALACSDGRRSSRGHAHSVWSTTQLHRLELAGIATKSNRYGELAWRVNVVNEPGEVDVLSVVPARQCPAAWWPPTLRRGVRKSKSLLELRRALITTFGRHCMICGYSWPSVVDHDHQTMLARGYVCGDCNTNLDSCVHPSGCPYSDYLNNPPAFGLQLRYPKNYGRTNQPIYQIRVERFSQLMHRVETWR